MNKLLVRGLGLVLTMMALVNPSSHSQENTTATASFRWSQPATLTPAFAAPDADNRYGEYISKVSFTAGEVSLTVDDDDVKESSQKARFLFGYNTREVEMRAYPGSYVKITVPEGRRIVLVSFDGAKVGTSYMSVDWPKTGAGLVDGTTATWRFDGDNREVIFYIDVTINCTLTTVTSDKTTGVPDIVTGRAEDAEWFTLGGIVLPEKPTLPGVYLRRNGSTVSRILVR